MIGDFFAICLGFEGNLSIVLPLCVCREWNGKGAMYVKAQRMDRCMLSTETGKSKSSLFRHVQKA